MKLKNILIVVHNIEVSKAFYHELFGLTVVTDFGENVILTEGLVLQEKKVWEKFIERNVRMFGNDAELYFEENDMDGFLEKLQRSKWDIDYVNPMIQHDWGQRVIRLYDPDKHMIEVGESLEFVVRRCLKEGMTAEETARKTQLPIDMIEQIYQENNHECKRF